MISVVLAARRGGDVLRACLESLAPQIEAGRDELIVITAGAERGTLAALAPRAVHLEAEQDALVPRLWGIGILHARAPWVALTSTDCRPADDWLAAMTRASREVPAPAAIGGPIEPPAGGRPVDWALYFARYHAFLPPGDDGPVAELAGENTVYRREPLERAWVERSDGFWEAPVNQRLMAAGETLSGRAEMRVRMLGGNRLRARAAERYRHGRHFGSNRVIGGRPERWARALSTPLLPPWLSLRIARRVARRRSDLLPRFLATLAWTLVLLGAWSAGEARGYLDQRKRIRVPTNATPSSG